MNLLFFPKFKCFILACLFLNAFVFAKTIETVGDYGQVVLPVTAATIAVFYKDKPGIVQFAESYLATFATVHFLKNAIHSKRPNGGDHSFPSGHTSSSFAAATFLHLRYGWKYGIPAYLAAIFVGYSRIEARKHWTFDVLAGAAIAISYNVLITKRYCLNVCPYIGEENSGIAINIEW